MRKDRKCLTLTSIIMSCEIEGVRFLSGSEALNGGPLAVRDLGNAPSNREESGFSRSLMGE